MKQLAGSMLHICTYLNVINATRDDAVLSKYDGHTSCRHYTCFAGDEFGVVDHFYFFTFSYLPTFNQPLLYSLLNT